MDYPDSSNNKVVAIRFYAELNDFLKNKWKKKSLEFHFKGQVTIKVAIESLGVPHTSVDLILANGQPVDFLYKLQNGDLISVYPEFETFDISEINKLRKKPLRTSRFVADAHLGKLARDLRMLGFDTLFADRIPDNEIITLAAREKRTILTRDRDLLKSDKVDHGYYIRAIGSLDQLKEVITKFDLWTQFKPFTRCLVCNGKLMKISGEKICGEVPPDLTDCFQRFFKCSGCQKIYWEGSHYNRMVEKISRLSERT
jgi:uncharacterized protein